MREACAMRRGETGTNGQVAGTPVEEPLWLLLAQLGPALVARVRSRMPMRVVHPVELLLSEAADEGD